MWKDNLLDLAILSCRLNVRREDLIKNDNCFQFVEALFCKGPKVLSNFHAQFR